LVAIFTKFDSQVTQEYVKLNDVEVTDKWDKARENAEHTFQKVYLPKISNAKYPPTAYVQLEGREMINIVTCLNSKLRYIV